MPDQVTKKGLHGGKAKCNPVTAIKRAKRAAREGTPLAHVRKQSTGRCSAALHGLDYNDV